MPLSVGDRSSVVVTVPDVWQRVFEGEARLRLEAALSDVLKGQRWFGGKARILAATEIVETIPIPSVEPQPVLLFIEVAYRDGLRETYALPVRLMVGEQAERFAREVPRAVLAHVNVRGAGPDQSGILSDAMWDQAVSQMLLRAIGHGARFPGKAGSLVGSSTTAYPSLVFSHGPLDARVMNAEQSNTSVVFGNQAILKLYRRLQPGVNPEWEIGRLLTSLTFPYSPAVGGAIEYVRSGGETTTVCLLQAFIRNDGDAWTMTLTALDSFLLRVSAQADSADCDVGIDRSMWELAQMRLTGADRNLIGSTLDAAACLGRRTAALHLALGQPHESS